MKKSPEAFRTITEVAEWLDTPAHVLRFWESRFSQIKPVKRAGGRRYYRPTDMLLLGGIKKLLHDDGTTIKAVQKLLREQGVRHIQSLSKPVSVQVSIKKKRKAVAAGAITKPTSEPVPEVSAPAETAMDNNTPATEDQDDLFGTNLAASTEESALAVIKLPSSLKSAAEIPYKDMQDLEALYYSLKMVRNNMRRTSVRR
jgi:DNA-binding transcriptional MerR regulator